MLHSCLWGDEESLLTPFFCSQLEEEAQAEAERRKFHAQSDQVVHKLPFIPEKSNKPLTEISNISLNTEKRASERADYDHQQKALEEEMLAAKKMVSTQGGDGAGLTSERDINFESLLTSW